MKFVFRILGTLVIVNMLFAFSKPVNLQCSDPDPSLLVEDVVLATRIEDIELQSSFSLFIKRNPNPEKIDIPYISHVGESAYRYYKYDESELFQIRTRESGEEEIIISISFSVNKELLKGTRKNYLPDNYFVTNTKLKTGITKEQVITILGEGFEEDPYHENIISYYSTLENGLIKSITIVFDSNDLVEDISLYEGV